MYPTAEELNDTLGLAHDPDRRLVPANQWQAAIVAPGGEHGFALVACIVTPGFDYADFTMATPEQVGAIFQHLAGQLDVVPG